jgi:hypothetical protein
MARMVAEGKRTGEIAEETGMSLSRISILKGDPAFQQLVEMYRANLEQLKDAAYFDIQKKYALLEANAIDHRNDQYEDDPDGISDASARADAELAGNMLNRKVNKNFNLNATADLSIAETLEARIKRATQLSARSGPGIVDASPTTPVQPPED